MKTLPRLVLLGAVLLESSCGLPDAYYLQPPVPGQLANGGTNSPFMIVGSSRANDVNVIFTGYELYYKCYGSSDSAAITADQNYGSPTNVYTDLLQNGFHRVCRGPGSGGGLAIDTTPGSSNAPLVDIQKIDSGNLGSTYTVKIIVNDLGPPAFGFVTLQGSTPIPVTYFEYLPPLSPTPTAGWEIRRYIQADPSFGLVCRTYTSNFYYSPIINWSGSDVDITSAVWPEVLVDGLLYVALYAVGYGTGVDGAPRASSPVWLGFTRIQIIN